MSKARSQGTRYETAIVNRLNKHFSPINNFYFGEAERLAEGGSNDLGDIRLELWKDVGDRTLIIEAKHRQNLNLHQTLKKAQQKAGTSPAVVFWKRLKRKEGNTRRTPDGVPELVAMTPETFLWLLDGMP